MDTPLHDFTGLSEQTIDLLWFRADQLTGNRDNAFAAVLALHRAELKLAKIADLAAKGKMGDGSMSEDHFAAIEALARGTA